MAAGWEKLRSIRMLGLAVFQQGQGVGEKLAEIDPGALRLAVARVGEEVADDGVETLGFAGDDADEGALIVGESGNAGEHLDRAGDGRERIANLMGDAGGEASDGGQAVAQTEFALEAANLGEVGKGVDVADGGTTGSWSALQPTPKSFSAPLGVRARTSVRGAPADGKAVEEELMHVEPGEVLLAAAQQNPGRQD